MNEEVLHAFLRRLRYAPLWGGVIGLAIGGALGAGGPVALLGLVTGASWAMAGRAIARSAAGEGAAVVSEER